jgi:hypothetical protein
MAFYWLDFRLTQDWYTFAKQGTKIDEIAQQVTQVADRVTAPGAVGAEANAAGTA